MASIGQATGSRVDSASKHIIPVRVHRDYMLNWVDFNESTLLKDKMRYCMHKDEIVLCLGKTLNGYVPAGLNTAKNAYPAVATNLGDIRKAAINYLIFLFHNATTLDVRDLIVNHMNSAEGLNRFVTGQANGAETSEVMRTKQQIKQLPDFGFMGVGLGVAFAHPSSGDNVASSQIGGHITIHNGAFHIRAGDLVQWYFEFEEPCFDLDGHRSDDAPMAHTLNDITSDNVSGWLETRNGQKTRDLRQAPRREVQGAVDRQLHNMTQSGNWIGHQGKKSMALPKSYVELPYNNRYYDRKRIFGRATSNARPGDLVDILICRQSM